MRPILFISLFSSLLYANTCEVSFSSLEPINAAHKTITEDLFRGTFIWGGPVSLEGNNHSLWRVGIRNNGRVRHAFFKPRQWADEDGWSRTPMEYVAYYVNRELGMDYVPPVAYRRHISVEGHHFGEGALIFEVPHTERLLDVPDEYWGFSRQATLADHRVLSVLLQNQDGHEKNLLFGDHWVDGVRRPIFIDFGAGLRAGTHVTMTHYPAFRNDLPVDHLRRHTFERLKKLNFDNLKSGIGEFVSDDEIRGILHRRDGIVDYFNDLIRDRGWEILLED